MMSLYPWALCSIASNTHCELVHNISHLGDHDPLWAYLNDENFYPICSTLQHQLTLFLEGLLASPFLGFCKKIFNFVWNTYKYSKRN